MLDNVPQVSRRYLPQFLSCWESLPPRDDIRPLHAFLGTSIVSQPLVSLNPDPDQNKEDIS